MKRLFVACILLVLLTGCSIAKAEYMAPVDAYCKALQENDFSQMELAMPAAVLNREGINAGELDELRTVFGYPAGGEYTISAKERDNRRLPASSCTVMEDYLMQEYGCRLEVTQVRLVDVRLTMGGDLEGELDLRVVCYESGGHWYVDFSAANEASLI